MSLRSAMGCRSYRGGDTEVVLMVVVVLVLILVVGGGDVEW
jgi:hypothetical protein